MTDVDRGEHRTPEQWSALVKAYQASGQSQRAFCDEQGIGQSSLRYWKRRLEPGAGIEPTPAATGSRFVAVQVLEDPPALSDSGLVVISPHGVRVEITRGFDAATLARVLSTLEAAA